MQRERLQSDLKAKEIKIQELESHVQDKNIEIESARRELEECRLRSRHRVPHSPTTTGSPLGSPEIDIAQQLFLKQAVYHLLTDFHAEEQLRAIVSILNFDAQERKAVYAKFKERRGLK